MKRRCFASASIILAIALQGCGRTPSRYLGKGQREVIAVPHMKRFISLSFNAQGSSTVKDVTYEAKDGYVYTQEFKDASLMTGVIRWVPDSESASLIQSRSLSRWTGTPVNMKMPPDCKQVLGVDVAFVSEDERVKNLTYLSTDGKIYAKEYKDGLMNRHLGGWLEIKPME